MLIRVQRGATGGFTGEHPSRRTAQSVEFADYRNYMPGDDLRLIDWNVYARTIPDLKQRFTSFVTYLRQFGVFPCPPLLLREEEVYTLIDGCHRVSAFISLDEFAPVKALQECWVAEYPVKPEPNQTTTANDLHAD